jgi:hypothetical protein
MGFRKNQFRTLVQNSKARDAGIIFTWDLFLRVIEVRILLDLGSNQVKLLITSNSFAFCKEQQHSQKQEFFVVMV